MTSATSQKPIDFMQCDRYPDPLDAPVPPADLYPYPRARRQEIEAMLAVCPDPDQRRRIAARRSALSASDDRFFLQRLQQLLSEWIRDARLARSCRSELRESPCYARSPLGRAARYTPFVQRLADLAEEILPGSSPAPGTAWIPPRTECSDPARPARRSIFLRPWSWFLSLFSSLFGPAAGVRRSRGGQRSQIGPRPGRSINAINTSAIDNADPQTTTP